MSAWFIVFIYNHPAPSSPQPQRDGEQNLKRSRSDRGVQVIFRDLFGPQKGEYTLTSIAIYVQIYIVVPKKQAEYLIIEFTQN